MESTHTKIAKLAFREGILTAAVVLYESAKKKPEGSSRNLLRDIAAILQNDIDQITEQYFAKTQRPPVE